nr:hypothetical protein [uncultured Rhodoferax sp.]
MTIACRLLKEFWLPALIAIAWTAYVTIVSTDPWTVKALVANFGPAFFLTSWATGQLFRVKKQADVESKLVQIERRAESLLQKLDGHLEDFKGYIYGAPSGVHLIPRVASPNRLNLALENPSRYPVIDFCGTVSVHHVSEDSGIANPRITQQLSQAIAFPQAEPLVVTNIELQSKRTAVIARLSTRTHTALQLFVVHRAGDEVSVAFKTFINGSLAKEVCPSDSLRCDLQSLEAFEHRTLHV